MYNDAFPDMGRVSSRKFSQIVQIHARVPLGVILLSFLLLPHLPRSVSQHRYVRI